MDISVETVCSGSKVEDVDCCPNSHQDSMGTEDLLGPTGEAHYIWAALPRVLEVQNARHQVQQVSQEQQVHVSMMASNFFCICVCRKKRLNSKYLLKGKEVVLVQVYGRVGHACANTMVASAAA